MSKIKYHYNAKTFQYEPARISYKDILWYVSGVLFLGLLLFGGMITAHDALFDSENERALRHENAVLAKHKDLLDVQLASIEHSLSELENEDKNLYTRLFNAEPPEYQVQEPTLSKEEVLLAEASDFRSLLQELESKSDQLKEKSIRSNAAFGNRIRISKNELEEISTIPSVQPIVNNELNLLVSGFGERINPFHKGMYNHPGIDYAAPRGTQVMATAPGQVVAVNRTKLQAGYGNYVDINHGRGVVTRYAHLDRIDVRQGQRITKTKVIGTIGSSGGSIAPHLHYEVILDGEQVNPIPYLIEGLSSKDHNKLLSLSRKQNQSLD
jgi:murein DD-endopeptidase MepM/ murein hydrolase activator NlpD